MVLKHFKRQEEQILVLKYDVGKGLLVNWMKRGENRGIFIGQIYGEHRRRDAEVIVLVERSDNVVKLTRWTKTWQRESRGKKIT